MKLISTSSSKNDLSIYYMSKNKGPTFIKQINLNPNNALQNGKNKKESSIFKRRINYSNFISQKMKQNIIQRNQESYLKQNIINKSRYSYNNSSYSNGCPAQFTNYNPNKITNLVITLIIMNLIKIIFSERKEKKITNLKED